MSTRQKAITGVLILVIIAVLWEVASLFKGGKSGAATATTTKMGSMASNVPGASPGVPGAPPRPGGVPPAPQPTELLPKEAMPTAREAELMKLQQETEARYISALNDLQMLKVSKDIAETNQSIMAAKLATVTAEKNIVDLLNKPATPPALPPGTFPQAPVPPPAPAQAAVPPPHPVVSEYTVVSVSEQHYRWSAVLGLQGKLYNVSVGDVLPEDGSKVHSINRGGVTLEKDGVRKRVSLVSVI